MSKKADVEEVKNGELFIKPVNGTLGESEESSTINITEGFIVQVGDYYLENQSTHKAYGWDGLRLTTDIKSAKVFPYKRTAFEFAKSVRGVVLEKSLTLNKEVTE